MHSLISGTVYMHAGLNFEFPSPVMWKTHTHLTYFLVWKKRWINKAWFWSWVMIRNDFTPAPVTERTHVDGCWLPTGDTVGCHRGQHRGHWQKTPALFHSCAEQLVMLSSFAINSLITVTFPSFKSAVLFVPEQSLITKWNRSIKIFKPNYDFFPFIFIML